MYVDIAVKMLVGALAVFIILRVIGKKAISELTPFDLIYVLVLSGILEGAIYDSLVSVFHLIFAMALWAMVVYLIELTLEKTKYATKIIQGEPAVLISGGQLNQEELKKNHIDLEQLRALLRQHGCYTLKEAYYAILEINGNLTVIKKSEKEAPSILLVDEGRIDQEVLSSLDKDETWLRNELEKEGHTDIEDIIYCEWLPDGELFVYTKEETTNKEDRLDG